MRIAVCLSGLVRTYRNTFENFQKALLEPNAAHQIDVFISTSTTEQSNNSMERTRRIAWNGNQSAPFPEEGIDYHDLQRRYQPQIIEISQQIVFPVAWYGLTPGVNLQSFMAMTYKIYACDLLRRRVEKATGLTYDAVIRTRFDNLLPRPFKVDDLNLDVLTVPSMMQARIDPDYDWTNDKFAIGNSQLIRTYAEWYRNIPLMVSSGLPVQPEILLNQHLVSHGITIAPFGSEIELVRPQGF